MTFNFNLNFFKLNFLMFLDYINVMLILKIILKYKIYYFNIFK
jgi:hypothetical protein